MVIYPADTERYPAFEQLGPEVSRDSFSQLSHAELQCKFCKLISREINFFSHNADTKH